jgi:hypothetical protein
MIDLYYWQQDAGGRALGKRRDSGRRKHKATMCGQSCSFLRAVISPLRRVMGQHSRVKAPRRITPNLRKIFAGGGGPPARPAAKSSVSRPR